MGRRMKERNTRKESGREKERKEREEWVGGEQGRNKGKVRWEGTVH